MINMKPDWGGGGVEGVFKKKKKGGQNLSMFIGVQEESHWTW